MVQLTKVEILESALFKHYDFPFGDFALQHVTFTQTSSHMAEIVSVYVKFKKYEV